MKIDVYRDRHGNEYNIKKLIQIGKTKNPTTLSISKFNHIIDAPIWTYYSKKITPNNVLNDRDKYKKHFSRITNANTYYPILITEKGHVADGNHRIVKQILTGNNTIKACLITDSELERTKI